jgi:hypothetical protein
MFHGATAHRLYDVGYEIDLDRVAAIMDAATRPTLGARRNEATTFQIRTPPLLVSLGTRVVTIANISYTASLSARIFDFAVCSVRLSVECRPDTWEDFSEFGTAFDASVEVAEAIAGALTDLIERIRPAIDRPSISSVVEDYVVFRLDTPAPTGVASLTDAALAHLLLHEPRPLSEPARRRLFANRFSYYADDLVIITWDNALVVEPQPDNEDVEFVLEFANAQLLELRVYDDELDTELPALYDRIEARRRGLARFRQPRRLMVDLQSRVAAITEIVERAENAFKVTEDAYLAGIYTSALELFRAREWRLGIDRKLQIFREAYTMLNAEAQAARGEFMEIVVILLIGAELALGLLR